MGFSKQDILSKLFVCAAKYNENLLGNSLLFITCDKNGNYDFFSVVFKAANFQHLTGVNTQNMSAKDFFRRCLAKRLSPDDIIPHKDGTTELKLSVLPTLLNKDLSANMLADYSGRNLKLYTEKIAGNITACMGFVKDSKSELYVPNTVLRQDMRNISDNRKRIVATFQKNKSDDSYTAVVYIAKNVYIEKIDFPDNLKYLRKLSNIDK